MNVLIQHSLYGSDHIFWILQNGPLTHVIAQLPGPRYYIKY